MSRKLLGLKKKGVEEEVTFGGGWEWLFFSWLFNSTFWQGLDAPILSFTRQGEGWGTREVMLINDDDVDDGDDHDN